MQGTMVHFREKEGTLVLSKGRGGIGAQWLKRGALVLNYGKRGSWKWRAVGEKWGIGAQWEERGDYGA